MNTRRRYVTIQEAAEYLGCTPLTIRRRISSGELKGYRIGEGQRAPIRVDLEQIESSLLRPIPTAVAE